MAEIPLGSIASSACRAPPSRSVALQTGGRSTTQLRLARFAACAAPGELRYAATLAARHHPSAGHGVNRWTSGQCNRRDHFPLQWKRATYHGADEFLEGF